MAGQGRRGRAWQGGARLGGQGGATDNKERMSEAYFLTTHSALLFAFSHADRDHGNAAAAERQIATFSVDRYGRSPPSPRNLGSPENQAHLAGSIQRIVRENTRPAFQVLCEARFARLNAARQDAACNLLARLVGQDMPPTVGIVHVARLVRGCTGRAINVADLAEQAGVNQATAYRWRIMVLRFVRDIDGPGMATIEPLLEQAEIVGKP